MIVAGHYQGSKSLFPELKCTSTIKLNIIFKQNMNFLSDFFFEFIFSLVFE